MFLYVIIILFFISLLYILKEDLETKYIPFIGFMIMNIFSILYYQAEYSFIIGTIVLSLYTITIFTLELLVSYKKIQINERWMFLDTGIYDYFLYIFLTVLIITEVYIGFGGINYILKIFVSILGTIIIGYIFLKIHQKKVNYLIKKQDIQDFDTLDKALFNRGLQKIKVKDINKNTQNTLTNSQKDLIQYYKSRVPLFLFGNIFIAIFIILNLFI